MMRFIYFSLKITLQYAFRLYFRKVKLVNPPRRFYGRTIYVSNHASSFFDPVIIGVFQRPIVFFMTRSDVFKPALQPILWASHMLPIYREHDGEDTRAKNEEVFKKCNRILSFGRNLLLFGEGFTDDVFIRRLKPVKKGAARIGFGALEELQWKKKIYMAAIGVNYGDPNHFGSDILISNSDRFCLNDYREMYEENPAKAINEVTKRVEKLMQEQITHVAEKEWAPFHEFVCRLRRNGMNPIDVDTRISLKKRWNNSRKLALWMNDQQLDDNEALVSLKKEVESYFMLLKRMRIEERFVFEKQRDGHLKTGNEIIRLILGFFAVPIGMAHFWAPYTLVKRFTEKTFKRKVFWSSVKVILGTGFLALWNIPLVVLINYFVFQDSLIAWVYFLILPLFGYITYFWFRTFKKLKTKQILNNSDLTSIIHKRSELLEKINQLLPTF